VLHVHHHVLGVVDLLFHRHAEIALQHGGDPQRQRSAADELTGVTHFEDRRSRDRFQPRPLRQANPGAEAHFAAFQSRRSLERFGAETEHFALFYRQSDMVDFSLCLLTDQLIFLVLPDEFLHLEGRRALNIAPAVAAVLHIVRHLD